VRFLLAFLLLLTSALTLSGRNLEVCFVDVEGGKATLIVSPSGESLLIDAGYVGFNNRDARLSAAPSDTTAWSKESSSGC